MAIGKTNVGGSGGTGATLTITAPAGCTVTVSKDGKTKTKTAGADGVVVFKGLDTGEWTVTITDGADSSALYVMIYNDTSVYISSNSYCGSNPGAGANFSVNGYASEEKLLADAPNENTIGVVTGTAVPKWGFYASEPEVPAEGEIFFTVATESAGSFNALKKNALTVYPTLCQQSVSGEWVRKAAYIYKDGAWVQFSTLWNGELFEQGNVHADITGGWAYTNKSNSEVIMTNADTDTIIECNNGSESAVRKFYSLGKYDFTEWNTLTAVMDYYATGESVKFGVSTVKAPYEGSGIWVKIISQNATGTYNIDISTLSGSYYISSYSYGSKYRFSKIYVSK